MLNQISKFVPHLAGKAHPIMDLLKQRNSFVWDVILSNWFNEIFSEVKKAVSLAHYNVNWETTLSADASSYGIGAMFIQKDSNGREEPVVFASRSMSDTEKRYAQIEKEALAIAWACEKSFEILTDHKPLVSFLGCKDLASVPYRIQRFKMRLWI